MPVERTAAGHETPKARPPAAAAPAESNIKETVESILVAFVLAFIFRAFVVEAFVIPTGSMAPTLMGAHMHFRCADCGYEWDVNFSSDPANDENVPPVAQTVGGKEIVFGTPSDSYDPKNSPQVYYPPVRCPNCGYKVPETDPDDPDNDATAPPVYYGDRILVLKYLYLFQEPQRWDVVVFRSPHEADPNSNNPKPQRRHVGDYLDPNQPRYAVNYIKRLVGRPGEKVMVLDGDVYVAAKDAPSDSVEALKRFKIQRKPRLVQESLWRTVYDNDFIPHLDRAVAPWKQPWQVEAGSGWDVGQSREGRARAFSFDNPAGSSALRFDPDANSDTHNLTDWLAYDQVHEQLTYSNRRDMSTVSDLKLACDYRRKGGDGPLRLTLTKGPDTFTAELSPGKASILWTREDGTTTAFPASGDLKELSGSQPVRVEFLNVDYRVTLRLDGREVAGTGDAYQPDIERLLHNRNQSPRSAAGIAAERQACTLQHVRLSRDVYYLNSYNSPGWHFGSPGDVTDRNDIIALGDDEYFVLGDNSLISGDARTWSSPAFDRVNLPAERLLAEPGRVPGRFLLGKAFFVYWPAGYRLFSTRLGIIPDFGDMRFIH